MLNQVTLIGRVGQEPELRQTTTGKAICTFSVATDEGWGDNKTTAWHSIVVWEKLADRVAQYVHKGSVVAVVGRLTYETWKNKEGAQVKSTKIVATDVRFLPGGKKDGEGHSDQGPPASSQKSSAFGDQGNGGDDDIPF